VECADSMTTSRPFVRHREINVLDVFITDILKICKICPFTQSSEYYSMQKNDFNVNNSFMIDSASSAHVTNDRASLVNYSPLETPVEIKFNVLGNEVLRK